MSLYDKFGTDAALEASEGVDLDFGGGVVVTIHRAGGANEKFQRVAREVFKGKTAAIEAGSLDNDEAAELLADVYARSVLVGWRGVTDKDGRELPFSPANAKRVLIDLPEFFAVIKREAERAATFRRKKLDDDAEALGNG